MTRITFKNINKVYGSVQPLKDVSFTIEPGEFFALVGPSGSGKSTLLRIIAGLETITSGDLFFDDARMNDADARSRDVGMVFQNYALYPHLSVAENLAFPLSIRKTDKKEIARRVDEVAAILDLSTLLQRKPKELSGGQRQRVAVGRAIIRKPRVFLFDEPLSNLDAKLRTHMRTELKQLQRSLGITTVYVTHDQVEAMTMSDRMAILHDGNLQQVGTPSEVYDKPATTFVASFTGSPAMNLLQHNGSTIGIRPESFDSISSADPNQLSLSVRIKAIEFIGHEWLVHALYNDQPVVMRTTTEPNYTQGTDAVWHARNSKVRAF